MVGDNTNMLFIHRNAAAAYFFLSDEDDPTSWSTPYPAVLGGEVSRQIDALVWLTLDLGRAAPVAVHPQGAHP